MLNYQRVAANVCRLDWDATHPMLAFSGKSWLMYSQKSVCVSKPTMKQASKS